MDSSPADPQDYVKEAVLVAAIYGINSNLRLLAKVSRFE